MSDLLDLITLVQREFGDENEIQVTKADIVRWANDGQLELMRRTEVFRDIDTYSTAITSSTESIALVADAPSSSNFLKIFDVFVNNEPLTRITRDQARRMYPEVFAVAGSSNKQKSVPQYYFRAGKNLYIYPLSANNAQLSVAGVLRPTDLAIGTVEEFSVPRELNDDLVQYVLGRAYALNGDWQAVKIKAENFANQSAESMHQDRVKDLTSSFPVVQDTDGEWW